MQFWHLKAKLEVHESAGELAQAYAREVRWDQGFRVNIDSRLLLLGMRRLLSRGLVTDTELRTAAFVMGCRLGAMDSYESFDSALQQGKEMPLAFAYALPCMPLACASVCHSLRGVTYTLTGAEQAGIAAFKQAATLVESGAASVAVTGCWESPSQTAGAGNASCRLLLLVLEAIAGRDAAEAADRAAQLLAYRAPAGRTHPDSVATLKDFLASIGIAKPDEVCHV